jgi:hypothetical protein
MFLLSVKDDHKFFDIVEQRGLADLETAKDVDMEDVDKGNQEGFKGDSDLRFDLLMGRTNGILQLLELGYDNTWEISENFSEAISVLNRANGDTNDYLASRTNEAISFSNYFLL